MIELFTLFIGLYSHSLSRIIFLTPFRNIFISVQHATLFKTTFHFSFPILQLKVSTTPAISQDKGHRHQVLVTPRP